jgi:aminoglycoside 3-N-acetyltransferase
MDLKATLRKFTPQFLLDFYRQFKKKQVRSQLQQAAQSGNVLSKDQISSDLQKLGIEAGDSVLVHCSMSKIGYLENGPLTLIDALKDVLGIEGNILMPSSPNSSLQLEYVRNHKEFDVTHSPSALGAVSETFRKMNGVKRSLSPTEPVCAFGPKADWLVSGHKGEETPYTSNSPFARLTELKGKILYIGVTLDNAGTSLHLLEDAVPNFKYPVYFAEPFDVSIRDEQGSESRLKIKVHNPVFSAKRKCDQLIPMFVENGVVRKGQIGKAKTLCFDAALMLDVMIKEYHERGVTMYTPHGEEIAQ